MEEGEVEDTEASPEEDDVLREQTFKRPQGLNLDSFMVGAPATEVGPPPDDETSSVETESDRGDAAVGQVRDFFTMKVVEDEASDPTTQLAMQAEQTIGKGLAAAMIVVWTAIGALVGTVLPPVFGGLGLFLMAGFGLYLGERWIQRDAMHLLGITWVIRGHFD